jgi:hypothetical protein
VEFEMIENVKKDWQYGYEIDYLKSIESTYERYNSFTDSPFAQYKKNNIAEDLHNGNLVFENNCSYVKNIINKKIAITMYPGVVIAHKEPGDQVITKLIGDDIGLESICRSVVDNTWLYIWMEDIDTRRIVEKHFDYVGSKITTFGEIYGIYFKNGKNVFAPRTHIFVDPVENISVKKLNIPVDISIIEQIQLKLDKLNLKFKNHYSNYNKGKSWSAISLRGYTPDIMRIEKPVEMNKKWKEEHKEDLFELQDTYLRNEFPELDKLLEFLGDVELHRIRFMRLTPGGGELSRHTDQVDTEAGLNIDNISRLHFPIQTNPNVRFSVWSPNGEEKDINMKIGEVWVLDTRKPHKVINYGDRDRIHLVIDVKTTDKLKEIFLND